MAIVQTKPEVHYPVSDGKPMAESPEHLLELTFVLTPGEGSYDLRLWEPQSERWLPNPFEVAEEYELTRRYAQSLEQRVRQLEEELRRLKEGG